MTAQSYNNQIAHGRKCNGQTLAEQMAQQIISCRRWGNNGMVTATIQCVIAWDVHYSPFKVAA